MHFGKLFDDQPLAVIFFKLIDIISETPETNIQQRRRLNLLPSKTEGSLGDPSSNVFLIILTQRTMRKRYFQNFLSVRLANSWSHDGPLVASMICLNTSLERCVITSDQAMLAERILNKD
ncbi:hypothetical protein AVEN_88426-1 [Araneus ventricosus]|uniref:Uncharacterized protein n=1 Tax=Araneus ventricosus TaxID=182803 RepID=A0A4Y2LGN1_ARAVE|nr:hypothetical protein AVEN_88426-1 [Araneus ventricosus]